MNDVPERSGRWRTPVARALTVLGALLLVVSVAANFVERQALDADEFEETARQLISDEDIQQQVAATLTEQLFTSVDVQAALEERLLPEQQGLAGPLAGALRPVSERLALRILEAACFEDRWVGALSAAQQQVVRVLDDEARFLETEGGVVAIDLRPLIVELTDQLAIVPDLSDRVPEDAGLITVFETEDLETAQSLTRLLRTVAAWIWVLALASWIGAVFLARDRRREIRAIAFGFVAVGLLVLALRELAGRYIVDKLSEDRVAGGLGAELVGHPHAPARRRRLGRDRPRCHRGHRRVALRLEPSRNRRPWRAGSLPREPVADLRGGGGCVPGHLHLGPDLVRSAASRDRGVRRPRRAGDRSAPAQVVA